MMDRESIRQSLLRPTSKTTSANRSPRSPTRSQFAKDLGLDSVDVVGLVMSAERQFRVRLATEELMPRSSPSATCSTCSRASSKPAIPGDSQPESQAA